MPKYRHPEQYYGGGGKFTLIDYNGKLAGTWGWELGNERPVEIRQVKVSNIRADDWPGLIGCTVRDWSGNLGKVQESDFGQWKWIDVTNWKEITEERPFPKPRDGKRNGEKYTWKWEPGHFGGYTGAWIIEFLRWEE